MTPPAFKVTYNVTMAYGTGAAKFLRRTFLLPFGPAGTPYSFPYPAFSARRRPKTAQTRKTATSAAPVAKAKATSVGSPAK